MLIESIQSLPVPEVKVINFKIFKDNRGYFTESFRTEQFQEIDFLPESFSIAQINESYSKRKVVRGLHFQSNPYQGKLVRATLGSCIDLACDIRLNSPTFGKITGCRLSEEVGRWIWVPPGFAHGVVFPTGPGKIEYLCTGKWNPDSEYTVNIFSPEIDWSFMDPELNKEVQNLLKNPIIKDRDENSPSLMEWSETASAKEFVYNEKFEYKCGGMSHE